MDGASVQARVWDGQWYGPVEPGWVPAETGDATVRRLREAVERCKRGDFSGREAIFAVLAAMPQDRLLAFDAQSAALAVARASDLTDPGFFSYLADAEFDLAFALAGSGSTMLAAAGLPVLLMLFDEEQGLPHDLREQAYSSIRTLIGGDAGLREDLSADEVAAIVQSKVDAIGADYILYGAAASPAALAKRMTARAYRSADEGSRFSDLESAELLTVWSGLRCPDLSGRVLNSAEVETLVAYASNVASLLWRPGAKYFYGHDVDGGPGLHEEDVRADAAGE